MHTTSRDLPHVKRRKAYGHTWRLLTFALLLLPLLAVFLYRAPAAQAGGGGPIIHWDSSMIYAGQNNGYPWGPVGENTIVHGANFSPNQKLHLIVVPGDSNNDALVCKQIGVTVGTVTTNSSGTFDTSFPWPASAGQVNQGYSICSILIADGSVASSRDDGPFTVLASNPPVIDILSSSVQAGGTITVTGHNWVPPQQVSINIAGCAACEPGNSEVTAVSTTSSGLNNGSFSVPVMIPASTKPGNYVVDALTPTGLEAFYTTGVKHLTITAAPVTSPPTANPSATAPATVTQTSTATATATTTGSGTTTGSTNSGSPDNGGKSNTLLIIVLVAVALVLFAIAGVIIFMLMQRSPRKALPVDPAQYIQNMQQNGSPPNFGQPLPMQPGWPPSNFNQPTQQGNYTPNFGQPTPVPPNGPYNHPGQGLVCMNCGRPLPPNATVCNVCGMQQVGTPGPGRPDWVR
jgi:hypothetical protein